MTSEHMILLIIYILGFFFTAGFVYQTSTVGSDDDQAVEALVAGLLWPGLMILIAFVVMIYLLTWPGRVFGRWLEGDK